MTNADVTVRPSDVGLRTEAAQLLRLGTWGFADQALLSATNFVTMVLLARVLSPAAFGSFALMYTTLLFTNGFQGTLVTQPHNVLGIARRGGAYVRYTSSTAAVQTTLAIVAGVVILLAAGIAHGSGWSAAPLILALAPAAAAWMTQEFIRRALYTEGRLRAAFANDLIGYGGQTLAIAALWQLGHLTALSALYALAATSLLAVFVGAWQLRRSVRLTAAWSDVLENWEFGKWLAGGFVAYWFSSQLYLYLSAVILGTAATGVLKAALVVMGPLNVLLVFMDINVPIVLTRALTEAGESAFRSRLKTVVLLTAPAIGAFCIVVGLLSGSLLQLFYGTRYAHQGVVLSLLAVHYFVLYMTRTVAAAVRARRLTKLIFDGNVISGIVAIVFGWMIIEAAGVKGAVLGMLLSSLLVFAVITTGYVRRSSRIGWLPIPVPDTTRSARG